MKKKSGEVGNRIREIREEKGLRQVDFAKSLGISQNHVSQVESGLYEATNPLLIAIEHTYNIDRKWLLTGKGEKEVKFQGVMEGEEIKSEVGGLYAMEKQAVFERPQIPKDELSEMIRKLRLLRYKDRKKFEKIKKMIKLLLSM
ncbi:MAG: helix-turn-helix domain-containing protein [Candidatus Anammoxibacter sp.]